MKLRITQHHRDESLLRSIIDYLGCGRYTSSIGQSWGNFEVTKLNDIKEKIIPFLDLYQVKGVKYEDYLDFKRVVDLMDNKVHLTKEGLEEIRSIKIGMNSQRITNNNNK